MIALALLGLALAQDPDPVEADPSEVVVDEAPADTGLADTDLPEDPDPCDPETGDPTDVDCLRRVSPEERVELGWERVLVGDYAGAEIVATEAFREEGPHREEASYLYGYALEWGDQPEEAVAVYEAMLEEWPDGDRADDARFRLAATLGTVGRAREAHRMLRPFRRADLAPKDERRVQLLRGIWLLKDGKTRRGLRKMRILEEDVGTTPWLEAHALSAHVDILVESSNALDLDVGPRRQQKRLQTRARYMAALEPLIEKTIDLEQSHWILAELRAAGNGYEEVGDDLLAARVPRRLTEAQEEIYRDTVDERVEVVWTKALKWYELGIRHALNVGYAQRLLDELEADKARVMSKIEQL